MTSRWLAAAAIWEARVEAERGEEEEVVERWVGGEKTQRGAMTERSADVNLSLALMSQAASTAFFAHHGAHRLLMRVEQKAVFCVLGR